MLNVARLKDSLLLNFILVCNRKCSSYEQSDGGCRCYKIIEPRPPSYLHILAQFNGLDLVAEAQLTNTLKLVVVPKHYFV